ncbi:MAG: hypothetical protein JRJ60_19730 [Deltaproteobacteria bacterium]|nr:hypothetical protein [Deltaproteobacteria bacterium]
MKIDISIGELVDRAGILAVKLERITDPVKRENVRKEYERMKLALAEAGMDENADAFGALKAVNGSLWDIENAIRLKEKNKTFDEEFIRLARRIYRLNDERSRIKREINRLFGSELTEEKEYIDYDG